MMSDRGVYESHPWHKDSDVPRVGHPSLEQLQAVRDLVEVGLVGLGEMFFAGWKVFDREDGVLRAYICAVAAIDALVGIDEELGDGGGIGVVNRRGDGSGGALGDTNKILGTGIGNHVRHADKSSLISSPVSQKA